MNNKLKNKVLDWIGEKIKNGDRVFDVSNCVIDIGLDPFNKFDYENVEEVFIWHENMMNSLYIDGIDENN